MSTVQCPICALRFRYQSELEQHARGDHCLPPPEIHLPSHAEHADRRDREGSRILRFP